MIVSTLLKVDNSRWTTAGILLIHEEMIAPKVCKEKMHSSETHWHYKTWPLGKVFNEYFCGHTGHRGWLCRRCQRASSKQKGMWHFLSFTLNIKKKPGKLSSTCTVGWPGGDPTTFSCWGCVVPKDAGITLLPESCPIRMNTWDNIQQKQSIRPGR